MKVFIILAIFVALAAAKKKSECCTPPKEGAIGVAGCGFCKGKYYKLLGGVAGSMEKKQVAACFKVKSSTGESSYHYTMFDFNSKTGYYATGSSKRSMKCVKIGLEHAKYFKVMCPKAWPNVRLVAKTTVTSSKVPVGVVCSKFTTKKGCKVKLGGVFDKQCLPVIIKKKYSFDGQKAGGVMFFFGYHSPQEKYFKLPAICRNAKMMARSEMPKTCPKGMPHPDV